MLNYQTISAVSDESKIRERVNSQSELHIPSDEKEIIEGINFHSDISVYFFFKENIKRTLPTILSYDNDIGLPVIGIIMTRLGYGDAAPATTTMLNTIAFLQYTSVMPASFILGDLSGQLEAKNVIRQSLLREMRDVNSEALDQANREINTLNYQISRIPKNAMLLGLICSPAVLAMSFSSSVLRFLGQDPEVAEPAQNFLRSYAPFFLAFSPRLSMEFVLLAFKKQNAAMFTALSVLGVTIGLEYFLAFQTSLGLTGLGLGNGIGTVLTAIGFSICAAYYFKDFQFFRSFFSWNRLDCLQIFSLLKEAGPIIFTGISDVSVAFAVSLIAGTLPGNAIQIQNVGTQYLNINSLITASASQTLGLMAAEQRGKAKENQASYDSIKQAAKAGVLATLVLQFPLALFGCVFTAKFSDLVGASNDNEATTRNLMLITAGYSFVEGVRLNMLQAVRAIGDNATPSIISSCILWAGVGVSYVLSKQADLGVLGLPTGLSIGALGGTVVLANRLQNRVNLVRRQDHSQADSSENTNARQSSSWCCVFNKKKNSLLLPAKQEVPTPRRRALCPSSSCVIL